jgi:hypothetical protein
MVGYAEPVIGRAFRAIRWANPPYKAAILTFTNLANRSGMRMLEIAPPVTTQEIHYAIRA